MQQAGNAASQTMFALVSLLQSFMMGHMQQYKQVNMSLLQDEVTDLLGSKSKENFYFTNMLARRGDNWDL